MSKLREEGISGYNPNILRQIPDWSEYFKIHSHILESQFEVLAQGGTVDCVSDQIGRLSPISHPVTIHSTQGLNAYKIADQFTQKSTSHPTLGSLYPWSAARSSYIPWAEVKVSRAARISSFDSGQEEERHFCASTFYDAKILTGVDKLVKSQGTDSLVEKATLEAVILSRRLVSDNKKLVIAGAAIPGVETNSDAVHNILVGLYAGIEDQLPGGVYIISPMVTSQGIITTQILPALGAVKLHSDGYFHTPNSGPILTVHDGTVYIHPLFHEIKKRASYFTLLPDLSAVYLQEEQAIVKLQKALEKVSIETVKNPAIVLDRHYKEGMRVFVVQARGAGNAPIEWKRKIAEIISRGDTTVMVITLADSGDVNLHKYAAGLEIDGVLSGRTLREDAAWILAGIIHDLKFNNQLTMEPQKLIELFCFLSGMIVLPEAELKSLY